MATQSKRWTVSSTNKYFFNLHEAKHARPIRNFEEDIVLLKQFGVNIGSAYHSDTAGTRIILTVADVINSALREKLKSAEFCGLLFDGSEDINKTEQEIVYTVSVYYKGEFSSDFLGVIPLAADHSAQDIVNGIVNRLLTFRD